ncbi:MAG TPA: SpoIID/LytB domain-containing protein [Gemmatimonadaceae bacterium]|jgi:stage II sporulation protein D
MRWARLARKAALPAVLAAAAACVTTGPKQPAAGVPPLVIDTTGAVPPPSVADTTTPEPLPDISAPQDQQLGAQGRVVRIALAIGTRRVTVSATGDWRLFDSGGASTLVRAAGGELWSIEQRDGMLRAVNDDGTVTATRPSPFLARAASRGAVLTVNGTRYRGEVWITPTADGSGLTVVNRLYLEDYLRGVVPMEIGHRAPDEAAAVQAQAIAARSYAYTHLAERSHPYDMRNSVVDQVYGGADAETPLGDSAVAETRALVLTYHGVVVNAPYHSACGGHTAAASEIWRTADEPYLVSVSDRIPGTDHYYCDIAPRFRWERTFSRAALRALLDRYLKDYVAVSSRGPGAPRSVSIDSRTASGRVRALSITTDRGRYTLRMNDIRFVLRSADGEILNSTSFSVDNERDANGTLARVVVHGSGYGHGVGMCQWGAIGRARAGQDFRTILRAYYPGTTVAVVGAG